MAKLKIFFLIVVIAGSGLMSSHAQTNTVPNAVGLGVPKNINELISEDAARVVTIPKQVKIDRNGKIPNPVPGIPPYSLSQLNVSDFKEVFPVCQTGNYYVGFQLVYDLGDKKTTDEWLSELSFSLMHGQEAIWSGTLQVNSKNQTFISTDFYALPISCDGTYRVRIDNKIKLQEVPQDNISLAVVLYRSDPVIFNPSLQVALECTPEAGQTALSWTYPDEGATEFDLEWVAFDNYEGTYDVQNSFKRKEPARITTSAYSFNHQTFYPGGYIRYRIRAVGYNPQYPGHRITGAWSYSPCDYIAISNVEPQKNWQAETVFAEDGKNKKVVQYFDGTLRVRQSLTNLSTEGIAVTGETMYDFEGRKSVEVLAAPSKDEINPAVYSNSLKFKPGINTFLNSTSTTRKKFNYDNERSMNSPLSTSYGAGNYYSASNTHASVHQMLIPDGEGFVYSQTEYTNDGTGRVKLQSGVGQKFKIDDNRATKYFYGEAAPAELYRLFGSNVGNASHYKKNMVIDANGQVSVSYLDQSDKIIATALAGEKPGNVEALSSLLNVFPSVNVDLNSKNQRKDGQSSTTHKILNVVPTRYSFTYDLTASNPADLGCPTCAMKVSITLTKPDGQLMNLGLIQGNQSPDTYHYIRSDWNAVNCTPNSNQVSISLTLPEIGDYTLTKNLTVSEMNFEDLKTTVKTNPAIQSKILELTAAYDQIDYSKCVICTTQPTLCTDAENAIIDAFNKVAQLDCENIIQQIKADLRAQRPADYNYEPSDSEIRADARYCRYELCIKDKESDVFEKQMARIENWSKAVSSGFNNPLATDPFFNNTNLSGNAYQNTMAGKINNYFVASINGVNFSASIQNATDPTYAPFFIDANGYKTNNNAVGNHILYMDLMERKLQMTTEAYSSELKIQQWALFKSFYLEAKRQIKLTIPAYTTACPKAKEELQQTDNIPKTEQGVKDWDAGKIITDPVTEEQLDMTLSSIRLACNPEGPFIDPDYPEPVVISDTDVEIIRNELRLYFDSKPNFYKVILKKDLVYGNRSTHLESINSILRQYGCGLGEVAVDDPANCVKSITIDRVGTNMLINPNLLTGSVMCGDYITNDNCYNGWNALSGSPEVISINTIRLYGQSCNVNSTALQAVMLRDLIPGNQYKFSVTYRSNEVGNVYAQFTQASEYRRADGSIYTLNIPSASTQSQSMGRVQAQENITDPPVSPNVALPTCPDPGVKTPDNVLINGVATDKVWQKQQDVPIYNYDTYNLTTWCSNGTFENTLDQTINNVRIPNNTGRFFTNYFGPAAHTGTGGMQISTVANNSKLPADRMLAKFNGVSLGNVSKTFLVSAWVKTPGINYLSTNIRNDKLYLTPIGPSNSFWEILDRNYVDYFGTSDTWVKLTLRMRINPNLMNISLPLPDRIHFGLSTSLTPESTSLAGYLYVDDVSIISETGSPSVNTEWKTDYVNFVATQPSGSLVFSAMPNRIGTNDDKLYSRNLTTWGTNGTFEGGSDPTVSTMVAGLSTNAAIGSSGFSSSSCLLLRYRDGVQPNTLLTFNASNYDLTAKTFLIRIMVKSGAQYISKNPNSHLFIRPVNDDWQVLEDNQFQPGNVLPIYYTNGSWTEVSLTVTKKNGAADVVLPAMFTLSTDITSAEVNTDQYLFVDNIEVIGIDYTSPRQSIEIKDVFVAEYINAGPICTEYPTPTNPDYFSEYTSKCTQNLINEAGILRERAIDLYLEDEITDYSNSYQSKCMDGMQENLSYLFTPNEYHHTLYYYDQAGNLAQTVPPEGVKPLEMAQVNGLPGDVIYPSHELITRYQYNSLNQLIYQVTPDAGESRFWYNDKSQLRLSQNAQQHKDKHYSYSKYDKQGRITEVGEMLTSGTVASLTSQLADPGFPKAQYPDVENLAADTYLLNDVTRTHYDFADTRPRWINISNVSVGENSLTNITGNYWEDRAFTYNAIPTGHDGYIQFTPGTAGSDFVMGLSEEDQVAYNTIDFGLLLQGANVWVVENNNGGAAPKTTYTLSDVFRVERTGTTIQYLKNGVPFYTSLMPSTATLHGDCNFNTPGSKVIHIAIEAFANANGDNNQANLIQQHVRNRVAWVEVLDQIKETPAPAIETHYSYDIHGNVRSLTQQLPGLQDKRTDYIYDLASGKVNKVLYQYGESDQFFHYYEYDADNRITKVSTSSDGFIKNKEVMYQYYLHGPLARSELGEHRVQGLDYYYTLQGWLKGVNSPTGSASQVNDPMGDGLGTSMVAKDAMAYNLGYYEGDYKPIASGMSAALLETAASQLWVGTRNETLGLFNGNIAWMATDLAQIGINNSNRVTGLQAMQYSYDQLNRLTRSRSRTFSGGDNPLLTQRSGSNNGAYDEDYSYDANGNLLTLSRNNKLGELKDNFHYTYYEGTNRLMGVKPVEEDMVYSGAVTSNGKLYRNITVQENAYVPDGEDVTLRATENIYLNPQFRKAGGKPFSAMITNEGTYQYDAIGNLILDLKEGSKISWTPYGKVKEVKTKGDSVRIHYRYDAAGNRIEKEVTTLTDEGTTIVKATFYERDASGNVMAVYNVENNIATLSEQPIYGSSRLGQYKGGTHEGQQTLGNRNYELTNHLGNVLTVITDNINMSTTEGVYATVVSATDYYPFGLEMEGRTYNNESYRYGFNGKEKDNFNATVYDYGFRIYNPEIAKFLSVDPLTGSYPELTPYQFASNTPIRMIDLDGLEAKDAMDSHTGKEAFVLGASATVTTTNTVITKEVIGKMTYEQAIKMVGNASPLLSFAARYGPLVFLMLNGDESANKYPSPQKIQEDVENYELDAIEQRIKKDGCVSDYEEKRYMDLMARRRGIYLERKDIYKRNQSSLPPYENPGTHDPTGGRLLYNPTKSILPKNHEELWEKSVPDPDGNPNKRWTIEEEGTKKVIHRFQSDQPDGTGTWHWNGSTDASTKSGQDRSIPKNQTPNSLNN